MLLKLLLSLTALLSHPRDNQQLWRGPLGDADHLGDADQLQNLQFVPTDDGPQTPEEEAMARQALHGNDLFGGDMVLPDDFNQSAGVRDERFRWPGYPGRGVVPFVIDGSLAELRPLIYRAMTYYHQTTCIRFVERTNERDFVRLYRGNGCWSIIGRNGGVQNLSLGQGCGYFGLVVHELGHAIGLIHEHQRSDRDNYIYVYRQNVVPGQEHNFVKVEPQNEILYTPYDYSSIMHYGNFAFSRGPNRLPTMVAKNGQRLYEPYEKQGFTNSDVYSIKQLYKC